VKCAQVRERVAALIDEAHLDCSAIPDFEYTALQTFTRAEEKMRANGISLWLSALNSQALEVVRRSPLGRALGRERMFVNLPAAVKAYATRGNAV